MTYKYLGVSQEHMKISLFPLSLKAKGKEWFESIGKELNAWSDREKCFAMEVSFTWRNQRSYESYMRVYPM